MGTELATQDVARFARNSRRREEEQKNIEGEVMVSRRRGDVFCIIYNTYSIVLYTSIYCCT